MNNDSNVNKKPASAYDVVSQIVGRVVQSEYEKSALDSAVITANCEFCQRPASEFDGDGVIWLDSYKYENNICKTCSLFCVQLNDTVGNERGSIGYKLSSFKNGVLAVSDDGAELWLGGKYLERVNHNGGFKIVDSSGNQAKYDLCESIGKYRVVTEITLRREMFLRYLRLSDADNLYLATETGVIHVNKKQYKDLKAAFIAENLDKKALNDLFVVLNGYKEGRLPVTHQRVQSALSELSPQLLKALSAVIDPTSLLFMLAALKAGLAS